jgi:hypothetical protein
MDSLIYKGNSLLIKVADAIEMSKSHREALDDDEAGIPPEQVQRWKEEVETWEEKHGMPPGKGMDSPYKPRCAGTIFSVNLI